MTKKPELDKKSQLLKHCLDMNLSYETLMMVVHPLSGLPTDDDSRDQVAAVILDELKKCETEADVLSRFGKPQEQEKDN